MVLEIISQDRLGKYLISAGHNQNKALDLYGWNIQISEAFFPLLSASEVCLRNKISDRMIELYGNNWWDHQDFLNQIKNGTRIVKSAKGKLKTKGRVTSGGMTAELNFGFWSKMLLPRHEAIFWGDFRDTFSDLPANKTYNNFSDRCEEIREFRNRIFHHEPIFNRDISKEYSKILELIRWISPEKERWIKQYSRVATIMRQRP